MRWRRADALGLCKRRWRKGGYQLIEGSRVPGTTMPFILLAPNGTTRELLAWDRWSAKAVANDCIESDVDWPARLLEQIDPDLHDYGIHRNCDHG